MTTRILGIDIGSAATRAVLVEVRDDSSNVELIDIKSSVSNGIKKGSITNIEQAAKSIRQAVDSITNIHGSDIDKYVVSISGSDAGGANSEEVSNLQNIEKNTEIDVKQIERLVVSAQSKAQISHEYDILHTLPYKFILDDKNDIEDPRGMSASRLRILVKMIIAKKTAVTNLRKSVQRAGYRVDNIVLSGYASAISTLTEDEKSAGAVLIDMGHSTCNIVIYSGNTIIYNDFLPVGSNNITQDLSTYFHMPLNTAEQIKTNYIRLLTSPQSNTINVPDMGDSNASHEVDLESILSAIHARVEDTFLRLKHKLDKSGLMSQVQAGIVLTGGMTQLDNIKEIASSVFSAPVRLAKPNDTFINNISESQRQYTNSCVLGLALYGAGHFTSYEIDSEQRLKYKDELAAKVEQSKYTPPQQVVVGQSSNYMVDKKLKYEVEQQGLGARFLDWLKNLF